MTDDRFADEVKASPQPVVVDFWAPWCGPCESVHEILERMAAKYDGVKFVRMNVDDEKATPEEYAVRSIPTLLFFKGGAVANQLIDVASEPEIEAALQKLL